MKYFLSLIVITLLLNKSYAQTPETANDSLSYALGQDLAKYIKRMDLPLNNSLIIKAINDVLGEKDVLFSEEQRDQVIRSGMQRLQLEKQEAAKNESQKFLDENKKKAGVKVTEEGLQYIVLKEGKGSKPTLDDSVVVHYKGTLSDGKVFDSSYDRSEPLTLTLNSVIEAWKIGLPLMNKGSKYKFFVPYNLGYGEQQSGPIPAYSTLIFEIELLDIKFTDSDVI